MHMQPSVYLFLVCLYEKFFLVLFNYVSHVSSTLPYSTFI